MKRRIIITGNIGSGKSTVAKIFKENNYAIISADDISAKILEKNHEIVSKMFGIRPMAFESFKKELGSIVFSNSNFRKKLEDFMLPLIDLKIKKEMSHYESLGVKFVTEMPTYFENKGLIRDHNYIVILITAPLESRQERIALRNPHLSSSDIDNRIRVQIPQEEKIPFCDIVLVNKDLESLNKQVSNVIKGLK